MSGTPDRYPRHVLGRGSDSPRLPSISGVSAWVEGLGSCLLATLVGAGIALVVTSGDLQLVKLPEYIVVTFAGGILYGAGALTFRRRELWFAACCGALSSLAAALVVGIYIAADTGGDVQATILGFVMLCVIYGLPLGAVIGAVLTRLVFRVLHDR